MVQTKHSGSCVGYEITDTYQLMQLKYKLLTFFAGIEKDKRKQSSQNMNSPATHVRAGHEIVKQSSQNANSPALIGNTV